MIFIIRPISILLFFCKVFDRIAYDSLFDFICTNNILYDYQFGFRPKHSTQQAIITLIDKITKSLDNGDIVISLFVDLKKHLSGWIIEFFSGSFILMASETPL